MRGEETHFFPQHNSEEREKGQLLNIPSTISLVLLPFKQAMALWKRELPEILVFYAEPTKWKQSIIPIAQTKGPEVAVLTCLTLLMTC
jgi:hypothetical protein